MSFLVFYDHPCPFPRLSCSHLRLSGQYRSPLFHSVFAALPRPALCSLLVSPQKACTPATKAAVYPPKAQEMSIHSGEPQDKVFPSRKTCATLSCTTTIHASRLELSYQSLPFLSHDCRNLTTTSKVGKHVRHPRLLRTLSRVCLRVSLVSAQARPSVETRGPSSMVTSHEAAPIIRVSYANK
jgi:hypothetical protein